MKVEALYKFCKKCRYHVPKYKIQKLDEYNFSCEVKVLNVIAYGNGNCELEAKQQAALNILKKIRIYMAHVDEFYQMTREEVPIPDFFHLLCQFKPPFLPFPVLEIVDNRGTPDDPKFLALCVLGPIECFGLCYEQIGACQLAAFKALEIFIDNFYSIGLLAKAGAADNGAQSDLKKYRIGTRTVDENADCGDLKLYHETRLGGIIISSPYNFYQGAYNYIMIARDIISNEVSTTSEARNIAAKFCEALKIKPTLRTIYRVNAVPLLVIKLDCVNDVVFVGEEITIFIDMIEYFERYLEKDEYKQMFCDDN